jgi:membrane protein DedA with SNARE-associated domain
MPDDMLQPLAHPVWLALGLVLTSYWLEDVAIAAGVATAVQGHLSWGAAFGAVVLGIASGDVFLYGLGMGARHVGWLRRKFLDTQQTEQWRTQLISQLPSAVLLARVIPGLRFVTYSACGFVRVSLPVFFAWVMLAVVTWTAGLFALSALGGQALSQALGVSPTWAVVMPMAALALVSAIWHRSHA